MGRIVESLLHVKDLMKYTAEGHGVRSRCTGFIADMMQNIRQKHHICRTQRFNQQPGRPDDSNSRKKMMDYHTPTPNP